MFSGHLENVLEMLLLLGRIPDTQEDTRTIETFETFFKKKKLITITRFRVENNRSNTQSHQLELSHNNELFDQLISRF